MRWPEVPAPQHMLRVAIVAPEQDVRSVLVQVADAGCVELDDPRAVDGRPSTSDHRGPRLAEGLPDLDGWARAGRHDLLAGEAELRRHADAATRRHDVAMLRGWIPDAERSALAARVAPHAGSIVALPRPRGIDPPTLSSPKGLTGAFAPLVATYATVPYEDIDPSALAGLVYVVLFGIMFADAGEGALLLLVGLLVRLGRPRRLARVRRMWPFLVGSGAASVVFGLLYGELFGPTHVLPVLWLQPLDHPVQLLMAGMAIGAVLLAGSYVLGAVNRLRESGFAAALVSSNGIAGAGLFLGVGALAGGIYLHRFALALVGAAFGLVSLALAIAGFYAGAGGGGAGATQAGVEGFDLVLRLGSNLVSFCRLAAFGLTHAALGALVWDATTALARHGAAGTVAGVVVFAIGTCIAVALQALVAGIQALRLEYYELFSRVFTRPGRPFRPWHVPITCEGDLA